MQMEHMTFMLLILDGDGDLDIVSANADEDTISWYENDGAANPTLLLQI